MTGAEAGSDRLSQLPSPEAVIARGWAAVEPVARALLDGPLTSRTLPGWLMEWSDLEERLDEAWNTVQIRHGTDTRVAEYAEAHEVFLRETQPRLVDLRAQLAGRYLAHDYSPPGFEPTRRAFEANVRVHQPANKGIHARLGSLAARYQRIMGNVTVPWEGIELSLSQVQPLLAAEDRAVREAAFRAEAAASLATRPELAGLFDEMVALRSLMAQNAGFGSFRDYSFVARHRHDYTAEDCRRLRQGIAEVVVPAVARTLERRRSALGVRSLRPWDLDAPLPGTAPLSLSIPAQQLARGAQSVLSRVDSILGEWLGRLIQDGLLHLEARPGKAPGAFCSPLATRRTGFITMSASGAAHDAITLMHESGHAFHEFAMAEHPLIWQRQPRVEAAEFAAMSSELLALPHLAGPDGLFGADEKQRVERLLLEDVLRRLTHIASVDAFQDWIYTHPGGRDPDARDAKWLALRQVYDPVVDWTGLTVERTLRWYRQLHIFRFPFYYIEYAIAQLGALQLWLAARQEPATAARRYRRALSLGATVPVAEVYRAAGAEMVFDREALSRLVDAVEGALAGDRSDPARTGGPE